MEWINLIWKYITTHIDLDIAIVGILITLFIAYFQRRYKKIVYAIKHNVLIYSKKQPYDKLTIMYNDKKVDNVVISKVALYNIGKESIKNNDISESEPLMFVIPNDRKILDFNLILSIPNAISFSLINHNDYSIKISFQYLDQHQGGVFQIIHNCVEIDKIRIIGSISGCKKIYKQHPDENKYLLSAKFQNVYELVYNFITTILWSLMLILGLLFDDKTIAFYGIIFIALIIIKQIINSINYIPKDIIKIYKN